MNKIIHFTLNGDPVEALAPVNMTMVDFLRKEMHLTGTKRGCEEGECGACTILLDGRAVPSCIMLAVEADGHEITTIEGVRKNGCTPYSRSSWINGRCSAASAPPA